MGRPAFHYPFADRECLLELSSGQGPDDDGGHEAECHAHHHEIYRTHQFHTHDLLVDDIYRDVNHRVRAVNPKSSLHCGSEA